jgi:hypothetical protein
VSSEVDKAIDHALTLFREHVERYPHEIVVEPTAWRTRCNELHQDLQWLLFCKRHLLAPPHPSNPQPPKKYPPPPPYRR